MAADLIIVLDRGRIVERGTHAELLRTRGLYAELCDRQVIASTRGEAAVAMMPAAS